MVFNKSQDSDTSNSSLFDVSNSSFLEKQIELKDFNLDSCLHNEQTSTLGEAVSPINSLPDYENTVKSSLIGQYPSSERGFQDDDESIYVINAKSRRNPRPFWMMFGIAVVLQIILCISNMTFNPQFTLQFKNDSPESRKLMSSISEGIKMISYLAKDLSVTINNSNSIFSDVNYVDTINTFSEDNVYQFDASQYCKYNTVNATKECFPTHGMDIFTSLVTDIGLQLGNVSKAEDPRKLAKSLVTTYSNLIETFDDRYYNKKNFTFTMMPIDLATIKVAHSLKNSQDYGKLMSHLATPVAFIHPVIWILLAVLCLTSLGTSKFSTFCQRNSFAYIMVTSVFVVVCFGITFFNWASRLWYFYRLNRLFHKVDIAHFKFSTGFFLMTIYYILYCLLLYRSIQAIRNTK